jgi:hypothetical protein
MKRSPFSSPLSYYRWLRRTWNYRPTIAYMSTLMRFCTHADELHYFASLVNWRKH